MKLYFIFVLLSVPVTGMILEDLPVWKEKVHSWTTPSTERDALYEGGIFNKDLK